MRKWKDNFGQSLEADRKPPNMDRIAVVDIDSVAFETHLPTARDRYLDVLPLPRFGDDSFHMPRDRLGCPLPLRDLDRAWEKT